MRYMLSYALPEEAAKAHAAEYRFSATDIITVD